MNYEQAIEYIHSINWQFCKPGLERVSSLCDMLGNPQDSLKFIHVAGTNGKGSFCAMTDSILRHAGYRVGLFTSPYIVEFNERMRINGENISDAELVELVEQVKPFADKMQDKPTEFELITAIAFLYFAKHKCDFVVLECGLGGRLDATNIIKAPILSVITGIALDHTSILGDTTEKIAAEKAGIIKKGCPVLWCGNDASAERVIRQAAIELKADEFYLVDRSTLSLRQMTLDGTVFDFGEYKNLSLNLLGTYQPQNASNVLSAIEIIKNQGVSIPKTAVEKGLSTVSWKARFEIISSNPLFIADGAHNPEGIDAAIEGISTYFKDEKVGIITGVMADKDYNYMAKRIASVAKQVFCLTPDNPRALPSSEYAKLFNSLGVGNLACPSVDSAVKSAVDWARKENCPVICLGSLYMYGDICRALDKIVNRKTDN